MRLLWQVTTLILIPPQSETNGHREYHVGPAAVEKDREAHGAILACRLLDEQQGMQEDHQDIQQSMSAELPSSG